EGWANLATAYIEKGLYDEAIEAADKSLQKKPDFAIAHNNMAVAHYFKKEYKLAAEHCGRAVELGYQVHPDFVKEIQAKSK
ncbi:MAG: tetratricopeptide repeat protein, partial [Deltaproteobacteria bacterium]|nr:tetratricopeptide repeat protein [Deltaproteobacteria bacterium]